MKIKFYSPENITGEQALKQHAYIEKDGGNTQLCGPGYLIDENEEPMDFEKIESQEPHFQGFCLNCMFKISKLAKHRYDLDVRSGCGAIIDTQHENFNAEDYHDNRGGLDLEAPEVVFSVMGSRKKDDKGQSYWELTNEQFDEIRDKYLHRMIAEAKRLHPQPEQQDQASHEQPEQSGPKTYEIETLTDMFRAVTSENVDRFLKDLRAVLLTATKMKDLLNELDEHGNDVIQLPKKIVWLDDGAHNINIEIGTFAPEQSKENFTVLPLDQLNEMCGYFSANTDVCNGFGCTHPENEDKEPCGENGGLMGKCLGSLCPIAGVCDSKDLQEYAPDLTKIYTNDDDLEAAELMLIELNEKGHVKGAAPQQKMHQKNTILYDSISNMTICASKSLDAIAKWMAKIIKDLSHNRKDPELLKNPVAAVHGIARKTISRQLPDLCHAKFVIYSNGYIELYSWGRDIDGATQRQFIHPDLFFHVLTEKLQ